jgi:uncharacterized membrane protein (UPF0182 family)
LPLFPRTGTLSSVWTLKRRFSCRCDLPHYGTLIVYEFPKDKLAYIPIETPILYVSPLYLRAETGQLPELKRVIAAYGDRVVMEETLPGALGALFREAAPPPSYLLSLLPRGCL